jgi:hypothetical protein
MRLQLLYSFRFERQFEVRPEFNLLHHRFVGIETFDAVWDHSTFTKGRAQLPAGDVVARSRLAVTTEPRLNWLRASEGSGVYGILIRALGSMRRFRRVEGPGEGFGPLERSPGGRNVVADFCRVMRLNATHASTTDPDAKLYREGPAMEAKVACLGPAGMENPFGFIIAACLTKVRGHTEPVLAFAMIEPNAKRPRPIALGGDRGYNAADIVNDLRSMSARPHVALTSPTAAAGRRATAVTSRTPCYAASKRVRLRIVDGFGWMKGLPRFARPRLRRMRPHNEPTPRAYLRLRYANVIRLLRART